MFSPVGKKKILLQIKRAKEAGIDDPLAHALKVTGTGSPGGNSETESEAGSPSRRTQERGVTMTTSKIDKLLEDKGIDGQVTKKLMEATKRYDPATDKVTLKLFQNKSIDSDLMRDIISKAFWLTFSDVEYRAFLDIFDPHDNGAIDGYQFMIAFIRLAAIRKDRQAEVQRQKQLNYEKSLKENDELHRMEQERKNEIAADFDFDPATKDDALRKLQVAAKKFDAARAPSLEAFNGKYMSAAVLREMLKRVFNLKVTGKELGAILMHFDEQSANDMKNAAASGAAPAAGAGADGGAAAAIANADPEAPSGPNQISCNDFLRQFLRLGIDARDRSAKDQRLKQKQLNKQAQEEEKAKMDAQENKLSMTIDYDFGEVDIARAEEKFTRASTNYDRAAPGCQSLDGFECESLTPGPFSDLVRRTFGLKLSGKELGYIIRKFDKTGKGNINCKKFINAFLKVGQVERDKARLKQLEKQRKLDELAIKQSEQKAKEVAESSGTFKISFDYTEKDMDSATEKLTEASVWFDRSRGGSLLSFEQKSLSPLDFSRALFRTFNIKLTPEELGAVIVSLDKSGGDAKRMANEKTEVNSKEFINAFMALGFQARASKNIQQIQASKEAEQRMLEEAEQKRLELLNKSDIEIDFNVTPEERNLALEKMAKAALKYDKAHPAAQSLDGFSCKELTAVAFYGLVRRTFNLKLNPKECGALVTHFDTTGNKMVNCQEFLTVFLQLGYTQRSKFTQQQLEKQRREDKARAEHDEEMMKKTLERSGELKINMDYDEIDAVNAQAKILKSAEGYDKNHPAAPSLASFDIAFMTPAVFKESMKRCFHVKFSPAELGWCVATYGNKKDMKIAAPAFLTLFLRQGNEARYKKQSDQLMKQRVLIKKAKEEEERMLREQAEGAEFKVDLNDHAESDLESALAKMQTASSKFHEHTSTLTGFTGGPMKPGEFRSLVRRSFGLALSPQETAALINAFPFKVTGTDKDGTKPPPPVDSIDSKMFLIKFMKLGHEYRAQRKNEALENQRKAEAFAAKEAQRKKRIADQKITTDIDWDFGEVDKSSIYKKLTHASSKYDKNAPGSVSLTAFEALYLSPVSFREVMKRTFNINMAPKELAVLINDFDNGDGNLHCQHFIVKFIQLGAEERNKFKLIMLEKQARDNERRKTEHARKMREAEEKMTLNVSYAFSEDERTSALKKVAAAAKKYDKNTPGSMSLDGFSQKSLPAGVFREMIKRTFGLILSQGELGAVMSQFDKDKTGEVVSQEFLIYFLKVGTAERHKDHSASLMKQRDSEAAAKKAHEDMLAAQWSKDELRLDHPFTGKDKEVALEKLQEAAFATDPGLPVAFQVKFLSGAIFREMIKRTYRMKLSDSELAALIDQFQHPDEPGAVDCKAFMVEFNRLGIEARRNMTIGNVVKNRVAIREAQEEHDKIKAAADKKMASVVDFKYSKQDFNSALEKIRNIAGNFERGHASSPSLSGFKGANMLPFEFKDMVMRTFAVPLTSKELGALTKFFDTTGSKTIDSAEFLAHFAKVNRQESELKRKKHLTKKRMIASAESIKEAEFQAQQERDEVERLKFGKEDEKTFLAKIRDAAEQYAVDSATMQDPLQAFKGSALNAVAFIDIFRRIFHGIRFSFKEFGVLLSIMNNSSNGSSGVGGNTIDGPKFLNWFYKLGRQETLIMLGEAENNITVEKLRSGNLGGVGVGNGKGSTTKVNVDTKVGLKAFNQKPKKKKDDGFNNGTLDKAWVLPAAANEGIDPENTEPILTDGYNSLDTGSLSGSMVGSMTGSMTSTGGGPRGGKKLALMLLSDEGHKVGGAPTRGASSPQNTREEAELGQSGMIVPSLPGGAMNNNPPAKSKAQAKKVKPAHSTTKEVVKETNPHTGKPSIGTQAKRSGLSHSTSQPAPAGFFFPTLLAGTTSGSSITSKDSGAQHPAVLQMPNVGFSGMGMQQDTSDRDSFY